ncbi:bifunctional UDP-N-acetylglucosamine diphosphorylase/glucosamine-1-phosphate N-acetyltransferase GlmU [Schlesneria paludicola]|uniref:bifunctional UDP-N-acetylglucosamine diphosphorylase/glucosamine-1-phosphate N-acetyltransferase GlmU n=1 Tax=Schlesneria paludicola TaxID=360056 RepID=UPI00058B0E0D|nr:NTP transferase domain-containing protein [Schlesneria paludicola]
MSGPMAVVLAAGKSTRMKSALPKVLHQVCGRPMVEYVLDAARSASVTRIVAIVGHRADLVQAELSKYSDVEFALQVEQKGTGHALMMCRDQLRSHQGAVLVLAGDTPLLKRDSLFRLLATLEDQRATCVIGTARTANNFGLGRIIRDADGRFEKIVEEKDATAEEKRVQEINTGCYAFDSQALLASLDKIKPNNSQAEYYLTDCPRVMKDSGQKVVALETFDMVEALGVNTREQLAEVTRTLQRTAMSNWMVNGTTIVSPENTFIDPQVKLGADTVIEPFSFISGAVVIGDNCHIGPNAVIEGPLQLESGTIVAPFQHLSGK